VGLFTLAMTQRVSPEPSPIDDREDIVHISIVGHQLGTKVARFLLLALGTLAASCVSEQDVMRGVSEAAYLTVVSNEDMDRGEGIFGIRCMVFHSDGTLSSLLTYPPGIVPSQMRWNISLLSNMITVSYQQDRWKYRSTDNGLVLEECNGVAVNHVTYDYVGSFDDAIVSTELLLQDAYPGGVASTTEHAIDAQVLYNTILLAGFNPLVGVMDAQYIVSYRGRWISDESSSPANWLRLVAAFAAIGLVSESTSWYSDDAFVIFEDGTWVLSTYFCRQLASDYQFPLAVAFYPNYSEMLRVAYQDPSIDIPRKVAGVELCMDYAAQNVHSIPSRSVLIRSLEIADGNDIDITTDEATELGYYGLWMQYQHPDYWNFELCEEIISPQYVSSEQAWDILTSPAPSGSEFEYFYSLIAPTGAEIVLADYPSTVDVLLNGVILYIQDHVAYDNIGYSTSQ